MYYSQQNFSPRLPRFEDGDVFEWCNFHQEQPHTPIGFTRTEKEPPYVEKAKELLFRHCNLINCDLPADATVEGHSLNIHVAPPPPPDPKDVAIQAQAVAEVLPTFKGQDDTLDKAKTAAIEKRIAELKAVKPVKEAV